MPRETPGGQWVFPDAPEIRTAAVGSVRESDRTVYGSVCVGAVLVDHDRRVLLGSRSAGRAWPTGGVGCARPPARAGRVAQTRPVREVAEELDVTPLEWSHLATGHDDAVTLYVYPGFGLHDELALLQDAGLTPLEALRTATLNPARYLGAADSLGTVAAGRLADLVLVDADPLADVRNVRNVRNARRVRAVLLEGRYLDRAALAAERRRPQVPPLQRLGRARRPSSEQPRSLVNDRPSSSTCGTAGRLSRIGAVPQSHRAGPQPGWRIEAPRSLPGLLLQLRKQRRISGPRPRHPLRGPPLHLPEHPSPCAARHRAQGALCRGP